MSRWVWFLTSIVLCWACSSDGTHQQGDGGADDSTVMHDAGSDMVGDGGAEDGGSDGNGADGSATDSGSPPPPLLCKNQGGQAAVQAPQFVKNIAGTGTSWFASPAIVDLDGDGNKELVGAFYDLIVWDGSGAELARAQAGPDHFHDGRIYAPAVVADLEGDGITEIVVGAGKGVAAYEYSAQELTIKAGWPVLAGEESQQYEVRGLAAADLDGDGSIELVATTTVNGSGSQVWVFAADGALYQPQGLTQWQAWPRYNKLSGPGNDADANGQGHQGYGCYGLNVGLGNIDDDADIEIIVTFDNHQINAFDPDGRSKRASSWYTNRQNDYLGLPLDWGQFVRWADPQLEDDHQHHHTGDWPNPENGQVWLQWTDSPPNVVDLDGDGDNEVVAVARAETNLPYETIYEAFMALEGDYGGEDRSARRIAGWESLPQTDAPQIRPAGWYPPPSIPAPTTVDLDGDGRPEIVAPSLDGSIYAVTYKAQQAQVLWSFDARHGKSLMYASEVVAADLNRDGKVELIFSTWSTPDETNAGHLVILDAAGKLLHSVQVPGQGQNGNGIGLPAAPAVGDLDGDGALEIIVQSFDHGLDIFTLPGSGTGCLLWPTGRGGPLRAGQS